MKDRQGENLRELLGRFVEAERAREMAEDIERGEQILGRHPAPEPSLDVLLGIKAQMGARLAYQRKRHHFRQIALKIATAAAVIIFVGIGIRSLDRQPGNVVEHFTAGFIPTAIWESDNIAADDLHLASFAAEIERIENEVKALLLGESSNGESTLDELETELREIEGSFWEKG
ncbi:MAG: hypothetical protein KAY65_14040 [Planctomycetes bacterium]|nr:hypothetical protein [Planctomycetota bacterium]